MQTPPAEKNLSGPASPANADPAAGDSPPSVKRSLLRRALLTVEAYVEWSFILFSLYVLSLGPMYWQWFNARHGSGPLMIAAFYEPLSYLVGASPQFARWLGWYLSFWV